MILQGNLDQCGTMGGEEFSTEFLRERVALTTRISDENQLTQLGYNQYHNNHRMVHENLPSVRGIQRQGSDSDALDFLPKTGNVAEVEDRAYFDPTSRCKLEYSPSGQCPDKSTGKVNYDRVNMESTTPQKHAAESPLSNYPFGREVSGNSFTGKMKLLCSFGGRILPRPSDGKLRYVGGETRIISIRKTVTLEELAKKTMAICNQPHIIKYQLPGEDLDALISVCSYEDLRLMIEEYQELEFNGGSQRLRIFLISSVEPDSPNSFDGITPKHNDVDYQYVFALNGVPDVSSQKSSSGHSLASQPNQVGTASDNGPTFHRESPNSVHALDNKDYNTTSSNLAGAFLNPAVQCFTPLQMQGTSISQSPPLSPLGIQQDDQENSKIQLYCDQSRPEGSDGITTFPMEIFPFDNAYHPNASAYYNGITQGPITLMNYNQNRPYFPESEQSKPSGLHFRARSPSEDFLPFQLNAQSDMASDRPKLKERAHSDSHLKEHDDGFKYYLEEETNPLSPWNNESEKPPSLALSNWWQELTNERHQTASSDGEWSFTIENGALKQELLKMVDMGVASSDEGRKECEGNMSNDNLHISEHQRSIDHPRDSRESGRMLSNTQVNAFANSVNNSGEYYQAHQSGTAKPAPDLFLRNENVTKDQQYATTERKSSRKISDEFNDYNPLPIISCDQKLKVQNSAFQIQKSGTSTVSNRVISCYDEYPANYPGNNSENVTIIREQSFKELKIIDALQQLDDLHKNKMLEPAIIVEDVTGTTPPDVPLSSRIIPHVEEEASDGFLSHFDTEVESTARGSESEEAEVDDRDTDESITDAAIAEIEAGIYGLQIIKNTDIEELQELGSGTFGTVYYGKWRGTDVAIKRIKKSCFCGRASQQEKLIKDFWREAQILSNLHHPNVVASYGVVPDGPGGTMATVTEYMVNGSLRHALQKKDKVLDRRKRLIIALDAAFGMEYLHLKNIVHFDLKCDNLLVNLRDSHRPICKVGDFGLSRIKRNTLVSGGVRGTLPWMAPELLDGNSNRVSEKVDVYSFGIAMWEILTGEEPYANMHCGAIIGGIVSNKLRPPIPEHCDPEWRKLMEECWSFNPEIRPSFTEITNRLRVMSMAVQPRRRNLATR
ncbi:uncharacterized protein LOC126670483 isoform X2 [Mercurialis annua]|uniref:uncharacterized protein LOC126670483 isoform X2 n=1 Tax=Mercurialis annua TaxID=3986 RepID=UPI00215FE705|nr:uncharacterized protein LOC126670483 isoform X2 [Mercurialis annua]